MPHPLMILLHFAVMYALGVIFAYSICVVEIIQDSVFLPLSTTWMFSDIRLVAWNWPRWQQLSRENKPTRGQSLIYCFVYCLNLRK